MLQLPLVASLEIHAVGLGNSRSIFVQKWSGSGGIRAHASEETGALNQRLRPLGHATTLGKLIKLIAALWLITSPGLAVQEFISSLQNGLKYSIKRNFRPWVDSNHQPFG